jgi:hypothetical protein
VMEPVAVLFFKVRGPFSVTELAAVTAPVKVVVPLTVRLFTVLSQTVSHGVAHGVAHGLQYGCGPHGPQYGLKGE